MRISAQLIHAQIHTARPSQLSAFLARILIANTSSIYLKKPTQPTLPWDALVDLRGSGNLRPRHLRDGHYAGSKGTGNAQTINTLTTTPGNWVNQDYLSDEVKHASYLLPMKMISASEPLRRRLTV